MTGERGEAHETANAVLWADWKSRWFTPIISDYRLIRGETAMKHLYLALMLVVAPLVAWAGTGYKWTDAEGNVHFTQEPPPPDAKTQDSFNLPQIQPRAEEPPAEQAPAETQPKKKPEDDISGMTREQLQAHNCQRAKDFLKSLQVEGPVAMEGADGKMQPLDETRRAAELKRAQELVETHCNAPKKGE
jgi:hypothetical protein